jgi:hypothetical protein
MRKYYTILFLFIPLFAFSQNNGINFQGVGRNSTGAVLTSQKISLRFSVVQGSETGTVEYVESKEVTTNAQGIFSVVIGDGTQISKTGNFTDINWKINPKFLRVEMDPAGGSSFAAMGTTRLQSVPFAYYANGVNADNVDGVLSASKGGTGVASISALKTALGVDQVNNTSDIAKPISTATQAALDTKVSTATFSTTVATKANAADLALKAPLESPTFTGTVAGITKAMVELGSVDNTSDLTKPISTATQEALDTKVSTASFSTTMATKANVADVELKANATDLALKAPLESPTFTGTVSGITKAMIGLSNVANTADLAKPISTATQEALDTKVSTATFSTTVATKANFTDVALKAPLESPTFTGTVSGITKAMVGLSDVENTADLAKPISTATQAAMDTKVSTETFSTTVATKENSENKSTATDLGAGTTSDILFPTQKAVKTYVDGQINSVGIADGGVTRSKIANEAVGGSQLANNSVGSNNIIDGTITNTDINSNASISFSKLNITKENIESLGIPGSDQNTTYTAGSGLTLSGSTFSVASNVVTSTYSGAVTLSGPSLNVDNYSIYVDGTNHKIGIGTNSPISKLEVNGASTNSSAFNANSNATIDFALSNLAYTTASAGSFTLNNIKDGGTYTLAVQGTTSGTSSFSSSGFTFFSTNNGTTTSNKQTLYTFIVMGSKVYFFMATGF